MKNSVFVLAGLQTLLTTICHVRTRITTFPYKMNNLKRTEKTFQQ